VVIVNDVLDLLFRAIFLFSAELTKAIADERPPTAQLPKERFNKG
jgi:hypothetical protein